MNVPSTQYAQSPAASSRRALAIGEHPHYALVATAIRYLIEHRATQPRLADLALATGVSETHLQRIFSAWAGISPKRFLQVLSRPYALEALRSQPNVLQASLAAGLSSPGRLHDLTLSCDAMTPGEIASGGRGLRLQAGFGDTPFGPAFIAWCERGICQLSFHETVSDAAHENLGEEWPGAAIRRCDQGAREQLSAIFRRPLEPGKLHLLLRGTNFQIKVWQALMHAAPGALVSYGDLARHSGNARASRAVGSAMARNRIAYLIPCHRVIRESGDWGSYRWGLERKIALHLWEQRG